MSDHIVNQENLSSHSTFYSLFALVDRIVISKYINLLECFSIVFYYTPEPRSMPRYQTMQSS